jgi:glycosyltransferase involved in cell wall biosynthesis
MASPAVVSVVIPSYNRAHTLPETIESVLAQSWPRIEIIVVDDGSTDGTEAAVAGYRDRITYVKQKNGGLAAARNAGFAKSTGEYVAWLDSDDLWNPDKTALQVAALEHHPDNVLVASDFSAFDADGFYEESHVASYYSVVDRTPGGLAGFFPEVIDLRAREIPFAPEDAPEIVRVRGGRVYEKLIGGNCLHPPTVMFRRDAALRAGWVDASFRRDSDYEYLLRLSRQGRVAYVERPLMRYRYSPDQMSSDKHLADIAVSRVLVMEALGAREPSLLRNAEFRRCLGFSHLAAANALSEASRHPALGHLLRSLRFGYADVHTARAIAKIFLPAWVARTYRQRRAAAA